ncbi:hypothetical protein [Rhizorhabdus histidinilytica]|uniref:hypothetical protein n=1 Tax=Rhizorhabdus histidinilytica TaxID=439228 RepID=UPI00322015C1
MSRDEQARELLAAEVDKMNRPVTAAAIRSDMFGDYMADAAIRAITKALRSASGGGMDATAMERLRIMSKQKLASEMEDHEIDCADWRGGYECLVNEARAVFASIAPDHPAENEKSSGEVLAELDGDHDDLR